MAVTAAVSFTRGLEPPSQDVCSICLKSLSDRTAGHAQCVFHDSCVGGWFERRERGSACPLCSSKVQNWTDFISEGARVTFEEKVAREITSRSEALVEAAFNGDRHEVQRLLGEGPVRMAARVEAIKAAYQCPIGVPRDHHQIAHLVQEHVLFRRAYRGALVVAAAEHGDSSGVQGLLRQGPIPPACRTEARERAEGNPAVLALLRLPR
jgi:hypothetical protein